MKKKSEKPVGSPVEQAERHYRMRHERSDLIEELIQEGRERGLFDDLPGKGKPLDLQKNPYEKDMELANKLLKDNDLPPAWILQRNNILADISQLRSDIRRQWAWYEREFAAASAAGKGRLTISWDDYCLKWVETVADLNKRIESFNLKRPLDNLEILKLNLEKELAQANAPRYLR
jgi:DnaJ family protein C protein 28